MGVRTASPDSQTGRETGYPALLGIVYWDRIGFEPVGGTWTRRPAWIA